MPSLITLVLVSLLATCGSSRLLARYEKRAVVDQRDGPPPFWTREYELDPRHVLPVRIALSQNNLQRAEEYILDVAGPGSPNFGKHWTAKQIAETFSPSQEAVDAVLAWLCDADSSLTPDRISRSPSRGWLTFNATVTQVENLLETTYHMYQHSTTGAQQIGSGSYSVPEVIREHVDFITPTLHFDAPVAKPRKRSPVPEVKAESKDAPFQRSKLQERQRASNGEIPRRSSDENILVSGKPHSAPKIGQKPHGKIEPNDLSTCDSVITPDCLRALYGIPTTPITAANNSLGIVEYSPNIYLQSDLDMFFANYSSNLVGTSPTFISIDGGILSNGSGQDAEADLDLEYSMTLAQPLKLTYYEVGDLDEGASFNNFLDAIDGSYCTYDGGDVPGDDGIYPDPYYSDAGSYQGPEDCGTVKPAYVLSSSYGATEAFFTTSYANRQCYEYMKLGLLGVTVLYSSGDSGVAGAGGLCESDSGIVDIFVPSFPSGCPYVTSVGGTQINPGASVNDPEVAVNTLVYSGGGFSNLYPIPTWQKATLEKWWATDAPNYPWRQFNRSQQSRGFPDISANAANYVVALDGEFQLLYGTSASTPVVASVITHINDELLHAGKKPVGFLNAVLYAHPEVLNDITSGDNPGCRTNGFNATVGWDPVTGLGTPNYQKMLRLFQSLQS